MELDLEQINRHEVGDGSGETSQTEGRAHAKAWRRKGALKIVRFWS